MMNRSCANCGAEVPDGASSCDNCGMPVSEEPPREAPVSRAAPPPRPSSSPPPLFTPLAEVQQPAPVSPPPRRGKRSRRGVVIAVGGLLVAVLGVGVAVWLLAPQLWGGGGTLEVPDVVGRAQEEAEDVLRSEGFEVEVQTREGPEEEAGEVLEQSPAGGEAEEGSTVRIMVGEAPPPEEAPEPPAPEPQAPELDAYASITDETGVLRVEVPREWSDTTGEPWIFELNEVGPGILAAPDLEAWTSSDAAPGMFFGASSTLVGEYDAEEVLDRFYDDAVDGCEYVGREPYDARGFAGYKDVWSNCGGAGTRLVQVAATPEDGSFLLTVQIGITVETDPRVEQRILDSFQVVGAV